jgi:phosphatidate cytidylyltransferase
MARIISSLILIPLALLIVIYAPIELYLAGIGLVGTVCLYEYFNLIQSMKFSVQPPLGYVAFWALIFGFRYHWVPAEAMIALVLIAFFLSAMWRPRLPVQERALSLMAELFGVFYCTFFFYPAISIRFDFGKEIGLHWTFILLGVIWAGDTFALVFGKMLGKHPFAPILSPKKTHEGSVAGLLAGAIVAIALQHFLFSDLPLLHVIVASILLGIFGQLGDLAESMLKRAAEIKDSSHIIPGHGGVLDRMDSLLFAFPILYFYLLLLYR